MAVIDDGCFSKQQIVTGLAQTIAELGLLTARFAESLIKSANPDQCIPTKAGVGRDQIGNHSLLIWLRIEQPNQIDITVGQCPTITPDDSSNSGNLSVDISGKSSQQPGQPISLRCTVAVGEGDQSTAGHFDSRIPRRCRPTIRPADNPYSLSKTGKNLQCSVG